MITIAILSGNLLASREFYPHEYCCPREKALTPEALRRTNLVNEVIVVRVGVQAWDHLMGTDAFTGRATDMAPQVILLYLKLPRLDGLGSLQLVCSDERTKLLSAAIFTSSIKARDQTDGYGVGANNYVSEPVDFNQFVDVGGLPPLLVAVEYLHQPGERRWVYLSGF